MPPKSARARTHSRVQSVDSARLKVLLDCFVHQSREAAIAGNLIGLERDILGERDRALDNRHFGLLSYYR